MRSLLHFLLWLAATLTAACSSAAPLAPPAAPLTAPSVLCTTSRRSSCNRAEEVESWLHAPGLRVLGSAPTPGGQQGAKIFTLAAPRGKGTVIFRAKWRSLDSESLINDPRKELGAYAVAKLFLDPEQNVVPPTTGHCFELLHYRQTVAKDAEPSFGAEGARCVFGILSYWLENAVDLEGAREDGSWQAEGIFDAALFERDAVYRQSITDLNLLTYLIHHGDAHDKQFLLTKDRPGPRVYSVDNSITFESIKNPMLFFREDWSTIHVPALSARSIERLERLGGEHFARLYAVESYEKRGTDLIVTPPQAPVGPADQGVRWIGLGMQIGLTEDEVAGVRKRLAQVVARVRRGELRAF
jgi:hypothetical protein